MESGHSDRFCRKFLAQPRFGSGPRRPGLLDTPFVPPWSSAELLPCGVQHHDHTRDIQLVPPPCDSRFRYCYSPCRLCCRKARFSRRIEYHVDIFNLLPLFPGRRNFVSRTELFCCDPASLRDAALLRGWPVLSWHLSPGEAPHVGQVTASICCGVSSFFVAEEEY
jgi:hypothetical protein